MNAGGKAWEFPAVFRLSRRIPGRFSPPAGISLAGYSATILGGFADIDPVRGTFEAEISKDGAQLVWVFGAENQPA